MSPPRHKTTPGTNEGLVSHTSGDSPLRVQGSNESSPKSSHPCTSPRIPAKAFPPISAEIMARVGRMEGEMDALKPYFCLTVLGGSKYKSQTQKAEKPSNWIEWIGEDGRDRGCEAEELEWLKSNFKTIAELDKFISDTLAEMEDMLASAAKVRYNMQKVFTLMNK